MVIKSLSFTLKNALLIVGMLLCALGVSAQTAQVQATIQDVNNVPYFYATVTAQLVGGFTINTSTTDVNGRFSMNLTMGKSWIFTITEAGGGAPNGYFPSIFQVQVPIGTAKNQDISHQINLVTPPLVKINGSGGGGGGTTGNGGVIHATGAPANPCTAGFLYTNDSNGSLYSCNGTTWVLVTSGQSVVLNGAGAPSNPCTSGNLYTDNTNGNLYSCNVTNWAVIASSANVVLHGAGAPTNPCTAGFLYTNDSTGAFYSCNSLSWAIVAGGGGGGITPPAGDLGGTTGSPTVITTHLSSPLPAAQGGTGTTTPTGVTAGTGISVSGSFPNQIVTATLPSLPLSIANGGTGSAAPSGVLAGANVTVTGAFPNQIVSASGSGGGTPPAGATNCVQLQSGSGTFKCGSGLFDYGPSGIGLDVLEDTIFKGPSQPVDIRAYGARAINYLNPPAGPGITVNITAGSKTATISSASIFQNGDGVTVIGGGPAPVISTPTCPTVTPSIASAGSNTGYAVANTSGSTAYSYKIIAIDYFRGYTATCTVSISNGEATLGSNSVGISSITRSGTTVTVTTTAPHGLVVGAEVDIQGVLLGGQGPGKQVSPPLNDFYGQQTVATVSDNTHFTYVSMPDTAIGDATAGDANTGTVYWYNENYFTFATPPVSVWEYAIYGRSGGTFNFIGFTHPAALAGNGKELYFEDYGATMSGNKFAPAYLPTTAPPAAGNQLLTTTIVAGAGTTTLTLANAATNSVTNGIIMFDDAPAISAAFLAATSIGNYGAISIPNPGLSPANHVGYVVNSPLNLSVADPYYAPITEGGVLVLNDTLIYNGIWHGELQPNVNSQVNGCQQFAIECNTPVIIGAADPAVYSPGGLHVTGISFDGPGQSSVLVGAGVAEFDSMTIYTANNNDYNGTGIYWLCQDGAGGCASGFTMKHNLLYPGPGQAAGASSTPFVQLKNIAESNFQGNYLVRRGIYFKPNQSGLQVDFDNQFEMQGAVNPMFTIVNNSALTIFKIRSAIMDTSNEPVIASLGLVGGVQGGYLIFEASYANQISGLPWKSVTNAGYGSGVNKYFTKSLYNVLDFGLISASGNPVIATIPPTIASGFNTSGYTINAPVSTAAFTVTVGTGSGTSTGVLTLPAAATGWNCLATNQTRADHIQQTASGTTSATLTNYGTGFSATNFTNSDVIQVSCFAY